MKKSSLFIYTTQEGGQPFVNSFDKIKDPKGRAHIRQALAKLILSNAKGSVKKLKGAAGLWEIKIDSGPGYRIYLGVKNKMIVLLGLGTKKSQRTDVKLAIKYWNDYKNNLSLV